MEQRANLVALMCLKTAVCELPAATKRKEMNIFQDIILNIYMFIFDAKEAKKNGDQNCECGKAGANETLTFTFFPSLHFNSRSYVQTQMYVYMYIERMDNILPALSTV